MFQHHKRLISIYIVVGSLAFLASFITTILLRPNTLTTPISTSTVFRFLSGSEPSRNHKVVYGFLPYWNSKKFILQPELTHLAYFSLTIGGDGSLLTRIDGDPDPGYHRFQSDEIEATFLSARKQNTKVELVLSQFDNDDIVSLLQSQKAQQNVLTALDSILISTPIDGINVDIEYSGEVTPLLRQKLTQFMQLLSKHIAEKYQGVTLSIDMYASASENKHIWDIHPIAQTVDYVVVMAYDFHRRSSSTAGPVAPIFGGKKVWDSDIAQHLKEFITLIPKEKILLGVPFYGYEWQTTSDEAQAHTFPDSGSTASFERVQELLLKKNELQVSEHWNEEALSPYLSYIERGKTYVVYYENSRSISYKLDLANQLDLAGIAIWALGYEGNSRELWDVIERKF